jgi:plasmid stabilization system protein ParE
MPEYEVIITPDAEADLEEIGDYIAFKLHEPEIAVRYLRDIREEIVCRLNDTSKDGAQTPFVYYDRLNTLFNGSDQVKEGLFSFTFAVPKDISYSDDNALINVYAVNSDKTLEANGRSTGLVLNGQADQSGSEAGPSIYCYLNSESFSNGDNVNPTPYFVALLNDENGINASGSGIGHDLQLIIDGQMATTYTLNDYFQYDFGSYTKGQVGFSIPTLTYGQHKLLFRAWDVLNNSSTAELTFNVAKGVDPQLISVECAPNPAKTATSFRIVHDRTGCEMDVKLDVFDTSGRHLWSHTESGVSTDQVYNLDWDLTTNDGRRLSTGLYLYRVSISSDGSDYSSKAQKLIILNK